MVDIVLDEGAYARRAINSREMGASPVITLIRVAKYYCAEGYGKRDIETLLREFLIRCEPGSNLLEWRPTLKRIASSSGKYPLINIRGVSVTKNELKKISALYGRGRQRLMFTLLCLAKYGNAINPKNNNWVNFKESDVFKLAGVSAAIRERSLLINDLWRLGYVEYSRIVDNINIQVRIVEDGDEVMLVTDFRNLGNRYMMHCGEQYMECECCGKVVRKGHGKQKYCRECAVEVDRQKALQRYHDAKVS